MSRTWLYQDVEMAGIMNSLDAAYDDDLSSLHKMEMRYLDSFQLSVPISATAAKCRFYPTFIFQVETNMVSVEIDNSCYYLLPFLQEDM